jgi:hypothetical protein
MRKAKGAAAIAELAKRGHDKVRALLPELPTGLRRRLHDLRRPAPPLVLDAARAKLCAVISTLRDENGRLRNAFRP